MVSVDIDFQPEDALLYQTPALSDDLQTALRAATERALDLVTGAHPPRGASVARWLGVLPPQLSHAMAKGVEAMHHALAAHVIGFIGGRAGDVRQVIAGGAAPPPLPWMQPAALGCLARAGTFSGETIVVPTDDSFLEIGERGQVQLLLRRLAYQVLGVADVRWSPFGVISDPSLCQRLAAVYPAFALASASNWALYLTSVGYEL